MWAYDIECLKNYFLVCFLNVKDGSRISFEISEFKDDLKELKLFLKTDIRLIGYNCLNYDSQLIEYIIRNNNITYKDLYKKSQDIIDAEFPEIPEWKLSIPHLDLFKIWHFDNKAKATSLKWLQFMMNWHNIEEMPLDYWKNIKEEDRKSIEDYCWNDVESTLEFFNITKGETSLYLYKGKDKVDLRRNINEQFRVNCYNWNDVKIGDRINQKTYLKLTQQSKVERGGTKRELLKISDCISELIEFKSPELISFFNKIKNQIFYPDRVKENPGWKFNLGNLKVSFGFGGIHSIDSPRKVEANNDYYILDRDVTSMYPARILKRKLYPAHLGIEWLEGYKWIHDERTYKWKSLAKKDKVAAAYSEVYKLAMNGGGFGKTNEFNSWQYDPLVTFSVTLDNQLLLLMLAEATYLAGIEILSLNTDGILCKVKYSQKERYDNICKEWEQLTGFTLEDTQYTKFVQTSVNDYIAVTTYGDIKYKGDFEIDKELHKNKSNTIIRIALKEYFINGVPIEKTIKQHTNIYDFCIGLRSKQDSYFEERYIKDNKLIKNKLQKTIRYFISKKGSNLFKIYNSGEVETVNVNPQKGKSWYQTVINKIEDKDYISMINYDYYIYETKKIINQIEKTQLTLL
jgi:hypothetical protein